MRHVLSSVLAFHWTAAFGLLAMVAVLSGEAGFAAVMTLLGAEVASGDTPLLSLMTAFGMMVAGVVFFWAFVTVTFSSRTEVDEGPAVMQLAFAVASIMLTYLMLIAALYPVSGLFPAIGTAFAALLASYLASATERWLAEAADEQGKDDARAAARIMALGAAHNSLLTRISGRSGVEEGR